MVDFYSHAHRAAQKLQQAKGTPEQMRSMLLKQGVKPDELRWTGFDDWAKSKKSITRDEAVQFLNDNRVQVGEKTLREFTDDPKDLYANMTEAQRRAFIENGDGLETFSENRAPSKYQRYTLPGGENYREVLLTAPHERMQRVGVTSTGHIFTEEELANPIVRRTAEKIGLTMEDRMMPTMQPYKSSHWDTPNVLAHLRMKDRVDPEGRRVLHLEELQSDWAQQARKQGFKDTSQDWLKAHDEFRDKMVDDWVEMRAAKAFNDSPGLFADMDSARRTARELAVRHMGARNIANEMGLADEYGQIYDKMAQARDGLPPAPFVTATDKWTDLALKRALREAAEGNYDAIAWTPGAEQAKRYDLSKHVSSIAYHPKHKSLIALSNDSNEPVINDQYHPDQLESVIGKDVAKKLLEQPVRESGYHILEGQDLSVGGEGMIGYYDKIVPTQLQKLARQHDPQAQVAMNAMPISDQHAPLHVLPITDTMRQSIQQNGLPMFADGGSVDEDGNLTAYHGSPHDFERFDLSKVGTGQGEQAFGHGLYFASNEDVAKSYRDDLSSGKQVLDDRPVEDLAREGLMADQATPDQEIARFVKQYGRMARNAMAVNAPHLLDRYDELIGGERLKSAGKMYEVRIKAHPETILDWDKPIAEQPRIMAMLNEQHANLDPEHEMFEHLDRAHKNIMEEGARGSHAHYYLKTTLGNKGASDYLNGMGIKGIKYLDRGSRGVGEGSHNYVIFDDSLVNVARKYRQGGSVPEYAEGGSVDDDVPYHQTPEFNKRSIDREAGGSAVSTLRRMSNPAVSEAIRVIMKSGSSPRDAVTLSKRLLGRQ